MRGLIVAGVVLLYCLLVAYVWDKIWKGERGNHGE